jgi:hypothetical protein
MCGYVAADVLNPYETGPDHQLRLHLRHLNLDLLHLMMVSKNSMTELITQQNNHECGILYWARTATGYMLHGPEIGSRCGRNFPHPADRPLGPPSLLCNGYRVVPLNAHSHPTPRLSTAIPLRELFFFKMVSKETRIIAFWRKQSQLEYTLRNTSSSFCNNVQVFTQGSDII